MLLVQAFDLSVQRADGCAADLHRVAQHALVAGSLDCALGALGAKTTAIRDAMLGPTTHDCESSSELSRGLPLMSIAYETKHVQYKLRRHCTGKHVQSLLWQQHWEVPRLWRMTAMVRCDANVT